MIAELLAKIKVDISDLDKAKVGLRDFEGTLKGAFKREPGAARPEAALSGFIEQLSSGDFVGAIESVTRRLGVVGIVGTAAFGAVAVGVKAAITASQELDAKFEAINKTLSETPSGGSGMEGLNQMVQQNAQQIESVVKPAAFDIQAAFGKMFTGMPQIAVSALSGPIQALQTTVHLGAVDQATKQAEIAAKVKQTADAFESEAKLSKDMAELTAAQASGNVRLTAEKQAQLELDKANAQLAKEMNDFYVGIGDSIEDLKQKDMDRLNVAQQAAREQREATAGQGKDIAISTAERQVAIDQDQVAANEAIAGVKAKALDADVEKNLIAQINIGHLQRQLDLSQLQDKTVRATLQAQLDMAKAEEQAVAKRTAAAALKPMLESTQLSFKDLLSADPHGGSVARIEAHNAAIRAQREMDIAAGLTKGGFREEAFIHTARAEQIKAGIPLLKESEKNPELAFLTAVNSAGVFKDMVRYLDAIAKSVGSGNNPFLNR